MMMFLLFTMVCFQVSGSIIVQVLCMFCTMFAHKWVGTAVFWVAHCECEYRLGFTVWYQLDSI